MKLPPEKEIILLMWKDYPYLSISSMAELLQLDDIDIISKFYRKLKIFPTKPFYSEHEAQTLLSFSLFTFITKSIPFQPSFIRNEINYYTQEDILNHIYKNQLRFDFRHANFLSLFYKYHRPWAKIKCFFCGVMTPKVKLLEEYFTPQCPRCFEYGKRLRWKYRDTWLSKIPYRKKGSKYGFRTSDKKAFISFLKDSRLLPFTTKKRIDSFKEICRFLCVETGKMTNIMNYRVLEELKHDGPKQNERYVPKLKIRLERRYRSQQGAVLKHDSAVSTGG